MFVSIFGEKWGHTWGSLIRGPGVFGGLPLRFCGPDSLNHVFPLVARSLLDADTMHSSHWVIELTV